MIIGANEEDKEDGAYLLPQNMKSRCPAMTIAAPVKLYGVGGGPVAVRTSAIAIGCLFCSAKEAIRGSKSGALKNLQFGMGY